MNRYDIMQASVTASDPLDKQPWPDVLTVNYQRFTYNNPATYYSVDDTILTSPYLVTFALYQDSSFDDIVLNINNIQHLSLLEFNSTIKFPAKTDILSFAQNPGS